VPLQARAKQQIGRTTKNIRLAAVQRRRHSDNTRLVADGEEILIPNSLIAESMVENLTRNDRLHRIQIRVGVVYESDLNLVRKTLEQTIDQLEWRSAARTPEVYLREFGDSSVDYDVDVWIDEVSDYRVRMSDLHESVWWALKEKGITIAFPQLDLHLDQNVVDAVAKQNLPPART
jgi:potassium efflux system protein